MSLPSDESNKANKLRINAEPQASDLVYNAATFNCAGDDVQYCVLVEWSVFPAVCFQQLGNRANKLAFHLRSHWFIGQYEQQQRAYNDEGFFCYNFFLRLYPVNSNNKLPKFVFFTSETAIYVPYPVTVCLVPSDVLLHLLMHSSLIQEQKHLFQHYWRSLPVVVREFNVRGFAF